MYKPKTEKDIRCPMEYGMDIFGGKWLSLIHIFGVLRYETYRMGLDLRSYNDEDSYEEYMSKGKSKVAICFVDMAIAVVLAVFGR